MHYIIDGYNLLFRTFDVDDEIQKPRTQFLEAFKTKVTLLQLHLTIVFDAQHQIGDVSSSSFGPIQVIFTDRHITADDCIIQLLNNSHSREKKVVVTSDKQLAHRARRLGATTETAEEFLSWLNKRFQNRLKRAKIERLKMPTKRTETETVVAKEKKRKRPGKNATFAECFDYYLELFGEQE